MKRIKRAETIAGCGVAGATKTCCKLKTFDPIQQIFESEGCK